MNNYRIVIDPGHGGEDPGASGNGIIEKNLTLEISRYMYDRFKELGIPVYITRTTDETISPTERVNRILNAFGNNKNVIVVSNHINAGDRTRNMWLILGIVYNFNKLRILLNIMV